MNAGQERQPTSEIRQRAELITKLNMQLSDIRKGILPADGREDILQRKRALSSEQTKAKKVAKLGY